MRILLLLLLSIPLCVIGQKPIINSFSPTHVEVNQTVTISGSNLSGARVFFGGVEATVNSSTANTLKVLVPAGTRNDAITVLNNNLITQSSGQFFISFSGDEITNFSDEYLLSTNEVEGSDICLCDLNGDDLNDAIIAHNIATNANNNNDSEITLFQNQSTFTNTQFTKVANINNDENNGGFTAVTCGDIDNDGKPDVVFTTNNSQNTKQIFVYKNTSGAGVSLAYESGLSLRLPSLNGVNRTPSRIKIADIDGDGKSDLVVGNTLDNTVHIFRNTTSGGLVNFSNPQEILVEGALSTGTIGVADLNKDGMPDIATLGFDVNNSGIFILKNISTPGQINFEVEEGIQQRSSRSNLVLGDFDNDGLIDLAATNRQLKRVRVYRNNSSNGNITFQSTTPTTINLSGGDPLGIDVGDLNGDGLLDIAVPNLTGSTGIFIVENTTTSSISFGTPTLLSSPLSTRNVCIADINGDAKPDLAYTQNVGITATTNLGVFTNENCVIPTVTPENIEFCAGETFTLNATKSLGTTYSWAIISGDGDTITDTDSDATVRVNSGTSATVQVTITNSDGCSEFSEATFTLASGTPAAAPTISGAPTSTICVGDNFTLTTSTGQEFEWTKPDGSIITTESLDVSSAALSDGGTYTLRVKESTGCFSPTATVDIEVSDAPSVSILNTELDNFCSGEDVELTVSNLGTGFTYQWQLDGSDINSADGTSLTANQSGEYTMVVTDLNTTCSNTSDAKTINVISPPSSIIDDNTKVCDGFATNFTSSSTGETGFTLLYHWEIEDGSNNVIHNSSQSSISNFIFPDGPASYDITLTTGYDSTIVNGCGSTTTMTVEVASPPTIEFNQIDGVQKCQGDVITVGISSPASSEILSYEWVITNASVSSNDTISTATTSTIDVSSPINVDLVNAIVTITTNTGCTVTNTLQVRNFTSLVDISSPDDFDLTTDTVTLENEFFINLKVDNLISNVQWSPEELIDNPTSESVRVFPDQQVVPVTVTGIDANNCTVTSQVVINIDIVRPKKTFSPNGDNKNDCWEVYNISSPRFDCEAFIFDSRGRNILVTSEFDENCVWDGNFNGSPVPEGVYYYVIKCTSTSPTGDDISKSGSILLAR